MIGLVRVDITEKMNRLKSLKNMYVGQNVTFNVMMKEITPVEFSNTPWYQCVWNRMLVEHPLISVMAPYSHDRDYRSVKWVVALGALVNSMFIDTVLAVLFFADMGEF